MTLADIVPVIAALGGAGGGIYAIVKAFRERHAVPDRESPVPQDRGGERGRCVTHADLCALRAEMSARIDAADADCERRTQEAAESTAAKFDKLGDEIGIAKEKVAHMVGLLEGFRGGQPQSRRGR